jgi:hypothetical protein
MNTEDQPELNLFNVVGGASDERFRREVALLMENLVDPNTPIDTKRTITMEYSFTCFKDRSGASVSLNVKSKLAGGESVEGNVFLTRRNDEIIFVPYDPKQERLFTEQPKEEKRK